MWLLGGSKISNYHHFVLLSAKGFAKKFAVYGCGTGRKYHQSPEYLSLNIMPASVV